MGSPHRSAAGAFHDAAGRHLDRLMPIGVADAPRARATVRTLERIDAAWPAALADLRDAPARVYVRGGDLRPRERSVAIVGSRAASAYGAAFARRLAADLSGAGLSVVSGLARGIDAAAHAGALEAGGHTVAVLPAGLEHPTSDDALAARVERSGVLLTEVAAGPPFGRGAFLRRNRLIAALAAVTVVVEASERSGALSTASIARQLGRALLAVPGDVDRPTSVGTTQLLREGARVCAGATDVLAALPARVVDVAAPPRERVLASLEARAEPLATIAERAHLSEPEAAAELVLMEWTGLAVSSPGQRWRRAGGGPS